MPTYLTSAHHHGLLVEVGQHDHAETLTATQQGEGELAAFYYHYPTAA